MHGSQAYVVTLSQFTLVYFYGNFVLCRNIKNKASFSLDSGVLFCLPLFNN